jgi:hypothetical protein
MAPDPNPRPGVLPARTPLDEPPRDHGKDRTNVNEQDRKRKRALIAFQIFAYGWLLAMFLIQLYMSFERGWWDL